MPSNSSTLFNKMVLHSWVYTYGIKSSDKYLVNKVKKEKNV